MVVGVKISYTENWFPVYHKQVKKKLSFICEISILFSNSISGPKNCKCGKDQENLDQGVE